MGTTKPIVRDNQPHDGDGCHICVQGALANIYFDMTEQSPAVCTLHTVSLIVC